MKKESTFDSRNLYSAKEHRLNLAAFVPETNSLGPGLRAAIWVQGCPFSCSGCIAPEWIPQKEAFLVPVNWMVDTILTYPNVHGITISGGEPMMQADALYEIVRNLKSQRYFDVICYTGFKHEELIKHPPVTEVHNFLGLIDVLIDGQYIPSLNDNKGLRGSSNQRILHLTNRLMRYDFENQPRKLEIKLSGNNLMVVGIPTINTNQILNRSYQRIQDYQRG